MLISRVDYHGKLACLSVTLSKTMVMPMFLLIMMLMLIPSILRMVPDNGDVKVDDDDDDADLLVLPGYHGKVACLSVTHRRR